MGKPTSYEVGERGRFQGVIVEKFPASQPVEVQPDRGLGCFWCAADQPTGVPIRRIYRTTEVPEDAVCCVCHIGIRELQELFS